MPKFFIGPMSKNVVDCVIEFNEKHKDVFGFIPSRRQIDYNGGYVNNWTTEEFSRYVNERIIIERDHGGPSQDRFSSDNGIDSFYNDVNNFDIIHIDPWKRHTNGNKLNHGIYSTIGIIKRLYNLNKSILFEVGTEESIFKFSTSDFTLLIAKLFTFLHKKMFKNIKYGVIQSGVGLDLGEQVNTGRFNIDKLNVMIKICKAFNIMSKEHNGDYLTNDQIKTRFDIGLDAINIAPEFGQIETQCYLDEMNDKQKENFYKICLESGRWKKWVQSNFEPEKNKEKLIIICGHYVLSDPKFLEIKPNIDDKIKQKINEKLRSLYDILV